MREPTAEEITENLNRLASIVAETGDESLSELEKHSLASVTAWCVELVRKKYELVSIYYTAAEYEAMTAFEEKYGDLSRFH